jgi:oligoendopeptidase F
MFFKPFYFLLLKHFIAMYTAAIQKIPRRFVPENFLVTDWASLEPFFKQLQDAAIETTPQLELWLQQLSELEAVVSEDVCWRQIRMTCDTSNPQLEEAFNYFCTDIQPHVQAYADTLNRKLIDNPLTPLLPQKTYFTYLRNIRKNIELFREENIALQSELAVLQQQYGVITGAMTVNINGNEYTLQQAAKFLEHPERRVREDAYRKIQDRRLQDKDALNQLFDRLRHLRIQIAANAGYSNYTDYRFKELGRFDYTVAHCQDFHKAVKETVVPLVANIYAHKKQLLGVDELRPWDLDAEPAGVQPLAPFATGAELLEKTIACFNGLRPFFGDCLQRMQAMQHVDIDSRKGKAPGGYNCPLAESGAPFIFMNAAGQMHDVTTMVHEGGHAIHSFLAHPLPLTGFKEYPMEIAEVASMAMELFSMEHWDVFFSNPADLKRAKLHQLERVITLFPWIAIIDEYQHWLYANPTHTPAERNAAWLDVLAQYSDGVVNYDGLQLYREHAWLRQLHLFEVPFYYIEYGIAQLGAIGMWMQFKQNKEAALDKYCRALALGGTATLPELYEAAGLQFNFDAATIGQLMQFVNNELKALQD